MKANENKIRLKRSQRLQQMTVAGLVVVLPGCNPSDAPSEPSAAPTALTIESNAEPPPRVTTGPAPQADGFTLFQQHCQACHGERGSGGMGPALHAVSSKGGTFVANFIRDGSPGNGMPPFQVTLSPTEIRAVASYVLSLNAPLPASLPPAEPPDR